MKKQTLSLFSAILAALIPITTPAEIYDLNTDWSDSQNPNGVWSYRSNGDLLTNDPFPWNFGVDSVTKVTASSATPGYLEAGDVSVLIESGPISIRWTAPAQGTINVSGALWNGSPDGWLGMWVLTLNDGNLSAAKNWGGVGPRTAPSFLSSGSAGSGGLTDIPVQAGDRVDLTIFSANAFGVTPIGVNFSVTFTSNAPDPVVEIENLAVDVFEMNLQNGIENSLDSKLDAALAALVDLNVNNDSAACNSLDAFINAVEAQRGKKITASQASQLVGAAQSIKILLNCGP